MTARTPKQEILSEIARELAMRRNEYASKPAITNAASNGLTRLQQAHDFIVDTMPSDYVPKAYG